MLSTHKMSIITSLLSLMEQAMIYYLAHSFICVLRAAQYGALMLIENKQVYFIFHKSVASSSLSHRILFSQKVGAPVQTSRTCQETLAIHDDLLFGK